MKDRFSGMLYVTFPSGHVEKCSIITRKKKGKEFFINKFGESWAAISKVCEDTEGAIGDLSYQGDFGELIIKIFETGLKSLIKKYGINWEERID